MSLPLKLALAPLLIPQAVLTRRRLPKLPEAAGPRQGHVGHTGRGGEALSLLILGDSSAAGVGVDHQRLALAGQLSQALAAQLGRRVAWQLCARSGVTTAQALALVADARPADVAVVVSGVNDVVDQVRPAAALRHREALVQALQRQAGVRQVVMTAVPPMDRFAGLPQPLRWLAGRDAAAHEAALRRWAARQPQVSHLPFDLPLDDATLLARDGFHPGAPLYRLWGEALAAHIARAVVPRL
ncbi:SGNH/GDSL hydrolase family protein [Ideonella sp. DXS22W]|uniref:SGNH/GDSL hydrolase family protein n=1 Tax=Pseudaquabacterium inlustre TaxID=2984192 RepID=A0ABU9CBY7_9BURK